jgi:ribonuclease-3
MRFSLLHRIGLISSQQKDKTYSFIQQLTGTKPRNIKLYKLAFTHKSNTSIRNAHLSYERLEFLGDAILDAIISDILYKRFPYKSEGDLTQYRSNVVKRTSLNKIAITLGLDKMLISAPNANISTRMYGDILEAFIGALYLDKGYRYTFHFVQKKIIDNLMSTEDMIKERNYKSRLLEWGQQYRKKVVFTEEKDPKDNQFYLSQLRVNERLIAEGKGKTKKESHNDVARKALKIVKA